MSLNKKTIYLFLIDFAVTFGLFLLFYPRLIGEELDQQLFVNIMIIGLLGATTSAIFARKFIFGKQKNN